MSLPRPLAGMSIADESTVDPDYVAKKWSPELIISLDWKRLTEIARAMASTAGFELGPTEIQINGRADFAMTARGGKHVHRAQVRLTGWDQWMASADAMEDFKRRMKATGATHGIFIAPGGFTPAAKNAAVTAGIELVDAQSLAAQLNALPAQHSDFFFDIGTAGDAATPSCPVCLAPLKATLEVGPKPKELQATTDICYRTSDIVAEAVAARRIEISRNCEVHFLREVRAHDVIIHGRAAGDFICDGCMLLNPGAVLNGTVAARSVLVRPGAELNGETRILEGPLPNLRPSAPVTVWRCTNPRGKEDCKVVKLLPH